jgi:2-methylcitrate synthase/citrate synthase II
MAESQYHPGLEGVVAGETAISTLAGGLSYRGYAVEELAEHSTFEETAYLLLYGELPNADELAAFKERLNWNASVPAEVIEILRRIPPEADLMDVMRTGASLLAHWDADQAARGREANLRKAERLIAQMSVVVAARHRLVQKEEPIAADRKCSFAENLLRMLGRGDSSPAAVRALEVSLITYGELEFNASSFTVRVVASTQSDLHSAITAAIGALKGPLHGGANRQVLEVLKQAGAAETAEAWVRDALAWKVRITGFGHRIFKDGDPRAKLLKPLSVKLANETGNAELEATAEQIERIVAEKRLYPNVDWPTARIYYYLGLPSELFTPLFAVGRMAGWCAHFMEQLENNRLITPMAKYTGAARRSWAPLDKRP